MQAILMPKSDAACEMIDLQPSETYLAGRVGVKSGCHCCIHVTNLETRTRRWKGICHLVTSQKDLMGKTKF